MSMPLMPGLSAVEAPAGYVEALAALLDGIDPETLTELAGKADAWINGANPEEENPEEENPEEENPEEENPEDSDVEPEHAAGEASEDLESEATEPPDQQAAEVEAGIEDFDALRDQIQEAVAEVESQHEQLLSAIEVARDAEGVDSDALDEIEEEAAECLNELEAMKDDALSAVDEENATRAAEIGIEIRKKAVAMHEKAERMTQLAGNGGPALQESPALLQWAEKYRQS